MLLQLKSVSTPSSAAVGSGDTDSGPFLQVLGCGWCPGTGVGVHLCVADLNYLDDRPTRLISHSSFCPHAPAPSLNRQFHLFHLHRPTPDACLVRTRARAHLQRSRPTKKRRQRGGGNSSSKAAGAHSRWLTLLRTWRLTLTSRGAPSRRQRTCFPERLVVLHRYYWVRLP